MLNTENIKLLNQILDDNLIKKTKPDIFEKILNFEIEKIHNNRLVFKSNLIEMNKAVIQNIQNITLEYINSNSKKQNNHISQVNKISLSEGEIKLNPRPNELIQTNKNTIFDQKLKEQEENFKSLNHKPKPKDIDFSDNFDEKPLNKESYDETMKQREEELKNIMNSHKKNTEEAAKWLKIDNNEISKDNQPNENNQPNKNNLTNKNKKVTFNIRDDQVLKTVDEISHNKKNVSSLFLNKLKTMTSSSKLNLNKDNEDISNLLNKILKNQDLILNNHELILNKLNNLSFPASASTSAPASAFTSASASISSSLASGFNSSTSTP